MELTLPYQLGYLIFSVVEERGLEWVLCLVYGHPRLGERKRVWEALGCQLASLNCPLLVAGDYNRILDLDEEFYRNCRNSGGMEWLRGFNRRLYLTDARTLGFFYTWTNNRADEEVTFEKLDRVMGNKEWRMLFPKAAVLVLPIQRSDHSPLVVDTRWEDKPMYRPKRFQEMWLRSDEVRQIIARVWCLPFNGSLGFQLVQKQNVLMRHLRNWGNLSYKSLRRRMADIRDKLGVLQCEIARQGSMSRSRQDCELVSQARESYDGARDLVRKDRVLKEELDDLMAEEEVYWAQRAKQRWLDLGNRNSSLEEHWIKMQQGEMGTWRGVIPFAGAARRRAVVWRKLLLMGLEERFCKGVAAWCYGQYAQGFSPVYPLSSTSAEALAVLDAIKWAKLVGITSLRILTNSVEVVTALSNVSKANVLVWNIVRDFLDVVSSSFCYVNIVKATHQDVRDAHNFARSRLCNFINV